MTTFAAFLFDGLPTGWQLFFTVALGIVLAMFLWTAVLFARSWGAEHRAPEPGPDGADGFGWIFLVPALNEELTIRDSVARLLAIPVAHRRIVVIDDASDDATPDILREIAHPDLMVIRRELPDARRGKAAALNHAYQIVRQGLRANHDRVIVVVVDADGRLHPDAPRYAAAHFADPTVGGVQSRVRIYNRGHLLTWMQDVEFGVYGSLFQMGRNDWGTAGMGGNGQCNRLSALDSVADEHGPWRDRLTEDQDLGLRLLTEGWKGRQDLRATVDQQGLPRLRPLLRQRTRWSQGNLQAFGLTGPVWHAPCSAGSRVELLAYLMMPIWQGVIGVALVSAFALALLGDRAVLGRRSHVAAARRLPPRVRRHRARLRRRSTRRRRARMGRRIPRRARVRALHVADLARARAVDVPPAQRARQLGEDEARTVGRARRGRDVGLATSRVIRPNRRLGSPRASR